MTLTDEIKKKWQYAKANPKEIYPYLKSLFFGQFFTLKTKILYKNISIGTGFRARSKIKISGPGRVIIGNNVTVDISFLRVPSIITHRPESCVVISDGCYLGGVRISCVEKIFIGAEGLLGSTTIIDSDIIPTADMKLDSQWLQQHVGPIYIGSHFWAGTNAYILRGTTLGDECVLGAGAMIFNKSFPDKSLLLGNPARRIGATRK